MKLKINHTFNLQNFRNMFQTSNYTTQISVSDYIDKYRDAEKFIVFCQQCNRYNTCWACPPFDFSIDKYLKYDKAYIIGTKIMISKNIKDSCTNADESKEMGAQIITSVRKNLDKQLLLIENRTPDSRAFFAGTCHICPVEECTRIDGRPCLYPDKIRPSLESFGFDIGKTTESLLGLELKWSNDGSLPEYLTLVSGLFTNSEIENFENYFEEF